MHPATAIFRLRLSLLVGGLAFFASLALLHFQPIPLMATLALAILAGIFAWSAVITLGVLFDAVHVLRARHQPGH